MALSASSTHAIRALVHLAAGGDQEPRLAHELAREVGVPPHYLSKLLAALARAGVLRASRGVRGGYRLARPARQIALGEIVAPFEGKRMQPGCLLQPDRPCREDGPCSAHQAWAQVKASLSTFLDGTTLADIQGAAPESPRRARHRG